MVSRGVAKKEHPFENLVRTVRRLRAPGGCPWDRAQTHKTLRPYIIEEAYEVLEVIDRIKSRASLKNKKTRADFCEELGDLLMQVLIHSELAREEGVFDINDVARSLNGKLVRRHPHVFGKVRANTSAKALKSWEKQKAREKAANPDASMLDGVPRALPALQRAARIIERATRVGFQWKDLQGPLEKVEEELAELLGEIRKSGKRVSRTKIENELGDVLFSLCNVAFLLKISPEDALRGMLARFETRFRHVERRLGAIGKTPEESTLEEMDVFWNEAKIKEKRRK